MYYHTSIMLRKQSQEEIEVFRMSLFSKEKEYEFALKTRTHGRWPNEKHYTTNPLRFVGKYLRSEDNGGLYDNSGGSEVFLLNGKEVKIVLDYEGHTCFREVPKVLKGPTGPTGPNSVIESKGPTGPTGQNSVIESTGPTGPTNLEKKSSKSQCNCS